MSVFKLGVMLQILINLYDKTLSIAAKVYKFTNIIQFHSFVNFYKMQGVEYTDETVILTQFVTQK
jgi:hypothetical protein